MPLITEAQYQSITTQYLFIIKKFILPILPVKISTRTLLDSLVRIEDEIQFNRLVEYNKETGELTLVPQKKSPAFKLSLKLPCSMAYSFRATEAILQEISAVTTPMGLNSGYGCDSSSCERSLILDRLFSENGVYFEAIVSTAFERGLSVWLGGADDCGITIFRLLHKLGGWSRKTYEGHHVSLGIIVDKDSGAGGMRYIDFLESKHSAIVSDGVFSAVCLDRFGRLIRSESALHSDRASNEEMLDMLVPFEYTGFAGLCKNNKIGIIMLESGDILVIKDSTLMFSKRNGVWSAFDHDSMITRLTDFLAPTEDRRDRTKMWEYGKLSREIYKTLLDVSFSHTGGCLGIVKNPEDACYLIDNNRITYKEFSEGAYDDFNDASCEGTELCLEEQDHDIRRKQALANLIWYDGKHRDFDTTDRRLRMECMAFDGALIIDTKGEYITVGSIVSVGGGTGGGRTLAAQAIARYGMGIKISSDGGIMAYEGSVPNVVFSTN
ncbi:MAG: hypothetical protein IKA82_02100 [Clostridia bacterium]|nr:hypothetical protein [Clostridia bacterium]